MYDLNSLSIRFRRGQALSDDHGLFVAAAPRRATRSRSEDLLIITLRISDSERIPPEMQTAWLTHLAESFFKIGGTVTSAMRALIETLNLTLMEKNLQFSQEGAAVSGAINLAVAHRRSLFVAQCGSTHAYVLNRQGLSHHTDTSLTDRGLGVSRTPSIRFYQNALGEGAYFFTTDQPPDSWTAERLVSERFPNLEQLRRRLLNQAPADFRMRLVEIVPGDGKITMLPFGTSTVQPEPAPPAAPQSPEIDPAMSEPGLPEAGQPAGAVQEQAKPPIPPGEDQTPAHDKTVEEAPTESTPSTDEAGKEAQTEPRPATEPSNVPMPKPSAPKPALPLANMRSVQEPDRPQAPRKETGAAARATLNRQKTEIETRGLRGAAAVLRWLRHAREGVGTFFRDLIARWSAEDGGDVPRLSQGKLIAIAVAVPLVIVAIAGGVYLARGRAQQYGYYYEQAQIYAQAAAVTDDPAAARVTWEQALTLVGQAEAYRTSAETEQLRRQVEAALDTLDGALRLDYRPALLGELYSEIEITRIVSLNEDLYLLDKTGGRVIHARRMSQGYEVKPDFVCSSGGFEGGSVGDLVDMVTLPINNPYQAHILAVDAQGNLAYCATGQDPIVMSLPQPAGEAGEIRALAYNNGFLYALNPAVDSVRVYRAANGQFIEAPSDFFEGTLPPEKPDLEGVVDLAASGPQLVLLRANGTLVDCVSSGLPSDPVNCETPVSLVDGRPGQEDQPLVLPDATYTALLFTDPPDPSINVLDATNADIYRFSLRFRLNRRLRPSLGAYEVEDPTATAFTIGIDRVAFLAFGHQVFFAYAQ